MDNETVAVQVVRYFSVLMADLATDGLGTKISSDDIGDILSANVAAVGLAFDIENLDPLYEEAINAYNQSLLAGLLEKGVKDESQVVDPTPANSDSVA